MFINQLFCYNIRLIYIYVLIDVQVFFYEDILDPKWIFVIHYDPRLRHAFDDALVDTEHENGSQQNVRDRD